MASESSRAESSPQSKPGSIPASVSSGPSNIDTPMSVPTPDFIEDTEAWRSKKGLLYLGVDTDETAEDLEEKVIRPFEHLTSADKITEMEKVLKTDKHTVVDPVCIKNTANWATVEKHHKFDNPEFNAKKTAEDLATQSPKLEKIMQMIRKLDREDEVRHGRKFKHFIFSDIKTTQGAKAVAAALIANGYHLGYNIRTVGKKTQISVKSPEELKKTKGSNFFLLSSVSIYGEPLRVSVKKEALRKFNLRPDNVYGDLARIIVMDSGFKEGIDLFDIKYVHIFEPSSTLADQKQVIGRGTRTCGQKGLQFNPLMGWPLHVFKYDLSIDPEYRVDFRDADTAFAYYLKSKNIDMRLLNLFSNLENLAIKGSVDYRLNKPIHQFAVSGMTTGGRGEDTDSDSDNDDNTDEKAPKHIRTAEENLLRKLSESSRPGKKYRAVKRYIKKYFSEYKWSPVKMENLCGYEGPEPTPIMQKSLDAYRPNKRQPKENIAKSLSGGAPPNLIKLSPTQDFISTYFTAENPLKGMVLWQSVGTGKTCAAIATATKQFEPLGYTILWVTRTTLKNDIWKNMFDMVCHEDIRSKVEAGVHIPDDMPGRMRLLSKSWGIRPISYKQFSNLVSQNNQYYDQLVKRNGDADPLRKTLIIIDEAHKLYGGGDLSTIERPDMPAFHKALMNSYAVSGKDSVRVLFMTATPITEDPLEIVKLVNLCKPADQQMPTLFDEFAEKYLDDNGDFTVIGKKMFLDDIAGHISYLNREGDARQFARPILKEVAVPLVNEKTKKDIADFDVVGSSLLERNAEELRKTAEDAKAKYNSALEGFTKTNMKKVERICNDYPSSSRDICYKIAKKHASRMMKTAKSRADDLKTQMTDLAKEWRDMKKIKTDRFKTVRQTRKDNEEEYEEYKKTAYYKLKDCEKEWKEVPGFDKYIETHPNFARAKTLADTIREELVNVEDKLKSDLYSQQSKIRSYNNLLKTDLNLNETQVVRRTIADAKKRLEKTKKRNAKWMKRLTRRANVSVDALDTFQKSTKKRIQQIIREQLREESQMAKEEKKMSKMEETADEELTDTFMQSLEEAQNAVKIEMEEQENKVYAKAAAKEERRMNALTKKQMKERLAEEKRIANATRKQRVALEKQKKQEDKEKEKQNKQEEKEKEKQNKQEEKEKEKRKKQEEKEKEKQKKLEDKEKEKRKKQEEKKQKK
jgi:hypothetical protein